MKTTKSILKNLEQQVKDAQAKLTEYRKEYNKEHGTKVKRDTIAKIIGLHIKGLTNTEIVKKGFNKNTVNKQVGLYKKGVLKETTVVAQYLEDDNDDTRGDE